MKKFVVLWMNLILCFNALSLTGEDTDLLESAGILNSTVLNADDSWSVKKSEIDVDTYSFKGQSKSLINWNEIDSSTWLDYGQWVRERERRDAMPDWRTRLRLSTQEERFGEVIACMGTCQIFRGEAKVDARSKSKLYEGDEIATLENASAWILLSDGNLLRLSAKTSITLNEFNISRTKTFISMRLNQGHFKSFRRAYGKFKEKNLSETDLGFYPLKILKANREFYSREEFKKLNENQRQVYLTKKNLGHYSQYRELNNKLREKEYQSNRESILFIYSPVATLRVENGNVDMFYGINEKGYIRVEKKRNGFYLEDEKETTAHLMLRGYKNKNKESLNLQTWYEIDPLGKRIESSTIGKEFKTLDLLTKRIPSLFLAREILLREKYSYLFRTSGSAKELAQNEGFRLWDDENKNEMSQREKYLFEYTRRVETTNLTSVRKVFEGKPEAFNRSYYSKSFDSYLAKLKNRYNNLKLIIPELDDSEYYIWVLKYAKN